MRRSGWTPSIVPAGDDQNVYLVVDDLGRFGRVWREAAVDHTDLETVIRYLLAGEYSNFGSLMARMAFGYSFSSRRHWTSSPVLPPAFRGRTAEQLQSRPVEYLRFKSRKARLLSADPAPHARGGRCPSASATDRGRFGL
jgi:hypothetical protein